jgi:CheY-like chemotaxis protein
MTDTIDSTNISRECKSILLIDDDRAILQTMKDILEIYGYTVFTAVDGKDGITTLLSMETPPCLILLDLMMPGMNGWGFLDFQRGNSAFASIPVVICSAYEASARSVSDQQVLIKPVQLDSLVGAVKSLCA